MGKNKRNSIVFFPTFNKSSNSINRYSEKKNKSNNSLHVIHEKHNDKHEDNTSEKNSDYSFENDDLKKLDIKNNKSESMTQTYFNKTKVKLDKLSILFSKAHNQKLISFCGMKNYDNIIFSNYFGKKKKNNDRINKEKEEVKLFNKKIKLVKRYRIDIEDSAEGKKRKKKFLDNIIELRTYIANSKTQPITLRETCK